MSQQAKICQLRPELLLAGVVLLLAACERGDPESETPIGVPASFAPTEEVVQANGRTARCNTVHSLTLPQRMIDRLNLAVGADTAVISCSLQAVEDGIVVNLPVHVSGTVTTLAGNIADIDFTQVVEEETVSYVGQFAIDGKAGVRFDVTMVEPRTGARYQLDFEQTRI